MNIQDVVVHIFDKPITVKDVLSHLKINGTFENTVYQLIEAEVIRAQVNQMNITITPKEQKTHLDSKRRLMGLSSAIDLNRYLHHHDIQLETWKQSAENELLRQKLKQKVANPHSVDAYYEREQERLKMVCVARIVCQDAEQLNQIKHNIQNGEGDFAQLARKHSLEHNSRIAGGHLGCVGKGMMPQEIEKDLFSSPAGAIVGPYAQNGYWALYQVGEILHGQLNEQSRRHIADKLFSEWLRERVLNAHPGNI